MAKAEKKVARKAYRALRKGGIGKRLAKAGANNVGKAMHKAKTKSYRRKRRR